MSKLSSDSFFLKGKESNVLYLYISRVYGMWVSVPWREPSSIFSVVLKKRMKRDRRRRERNKRKKYRHLNLSLLLLLCSLQCHFLALSFPHVLILYFLHLSLSLWIMVFSSSGQESFLGSPRLWEGHRHVFAGS